jgi:Ca2+/H+ antiporter, TMEM165/GDT1 family
MLNIEIILKCTAAILMTEMGDKTQLLAFILAARFKKPWTVMAGIFTATVLNHFLAASFGQWIQNQITPELLRLILSGTFLAFAVWVLVPDKDDTDVASAKHGAFLTTTFLFFLAEMGDKTQLTTLTLAAKFNDLWSVTVGTTIGMLLADGLAVIFGESITQKINFKWIRIAAATMFAVTAVVIYVG